jgi:predicted HicB family RNase H-like nuclease
MARPRIHPDDRVTTAIRIPKELHEQLRQAAEERQLSVNYLVVKALEDFVEHLVPVSELQLTRR